jgi:hypothetical protein
VLVTTVAHHVLLVTTVVLHVMLVTTVALHVMLVTTVALHVVLAITVAAVERNPHGKTGSLLSKMMDLAPGAVLILAHLPTCSTCN